MRDEGERQFFALVSKGRARHCLRDGAEEAVSQGAVLVWVLWSPSKGFGLRLQPPPGGCSHGLCLAASFPRVDTLELSASLCLNSVESKGE